MRLGISNLAWEPTEDEAVGTLLYRYEIDAIDIAPGKYFVMDKHPSNAAIENVRMQWYNRGIEITGMQSLLFGTPGFNLFGPEDQQRQMLNYLRRVCAIGAGLGAHHLVFGSPRNRDRTGLDDAKTEEVAVNFFTRLGYIAQQEGVIICLEPNPTEYGANFLTTSKETARLVEIIGMQSIRMQFDTGAIAINKEDCEEILQSSGHLIGHIHASEPNLKTLGEGSCRHDLMASALRKRFHNRVVCIEMLASTAGSHLNNIEKAIKLARTHYILD